MFAVCLRSATANAVTPKLWLGSRNQDHFQPVEVDGSSIVWFWAAGLRMDAAFGGSDVFHAHFRERARPIALDSLKRIMVCGYECALPLRMTLENEV